MTKPLPDASAWWPRRVDTSKGGPFFNRCRSSEQLAILSAQEERSSNINNFDSGLGNEAIIRELLSDFMPQRYVITSGVVRDRDGASAGDFDVLVFNAHWFTQLKTAAAPGARHVQYPIEGVYAAVEVKQTLTVDSLDAAMQKLVAAHRLNRPLAPRDRVTENREQGGCTHFISNPLYSAIVATTLGDDLQSLIERFVAINRQLKRLEMVRALCILGEATVLWAVREVPKGARPAMFMSEDLYEPLYPAFFTPGPTGSALHEFLINLMTHSYHSVLAPEDFGAHYGFGQQVRTPAPDFNGLAPDPEWLERAQHPCNEERHAY